MKSQIARRRAMNARTMYLNGVKPVEYSDEFYTPDAIVRSLGRFDLDPCAGPTKKHARINVRRPDDGLARKWKGRVWLNPPYSEIHEWLERFVAHRNGILLVNARCETLWFQRVAAAADAIFIPTGRIQFDRPGRVAGHGPVGQALIAIGRQNVKALEATTTRGLLLKTVKRASAMQRAA